MRRIAAPVPSCAGLRRACAAAQRLCCTAVQDLFTCTGAGGLLPQPRTKSRRRTGATGDTHGFERRARTGARVGAAFARRRLLPPGGGCRRRRFSTAGCAAAAQAGSRRQPAHPGRRRRRLARRRERAGWYAGWRWPSWKPCASRSPAPTSCSPSRRPPGRGARPLADNRFATSGSTTDIVTGSLVGGAGRHQRPGHGAGRRRPVASTAWSIFLFKCGDISCTAAPIRDATTAGGPARWTILYFESRQRHPQALVQMAPTRRSKSCCCLHQMRERALVLAVPPTHAGFSTLQAPACSHSMRRAGCWPSTPAAAQLSLDVAPGTRQLRAALRRPADSSSPRAAPATAGERADAATRWAAAAGGRLRAYAAR